MSRVSRRQQPDPFSESIYHLLPQPVAAAPVKTRHKSMYPPNTRPTASTFGPSTGSACMTTNLGGDYEIEPQSHAHKQSYATFGKKSHYSDPTNYLKKSTKQSLEVKSFQYKDTIKPPVVKRSEKPTMGRRSNANFIQENALNVITAETKKKYIEEPRYVNKPEYGQVPAYLSKVKAEVAAEQEYIQQYRESQAAMYDTAPQMQLLEESERVKLVAKLKKKWEEINRQYQGSTHVVTLDTVGKMRRKEDYESNLQSLEEAIHKMSKPFVFVHDSEQYNHY